MCQLFMSRHTAKFCAKAVYVATMTQIHTTEITIFNVFYKDKRQQEAVITCYC